MVYCDVVNIYFNGIGLCCKEMIDVVVCFYYDVSLFLFLINWFLENIFIFCNKLIDEK